MILFKGTKIVSGKSFLIFENEYKSVVEIPVESNTCAMFLLYFDRLSPQEKAVETSGWEGSTD
jgi:hypothetical protein